jgi:ubiquinone/menaquinone biosynthesis C-methylase UbiE
MDAPVDRRDPSSRRVLGRDRVGLGFPKEVPMNNKNGFLSSYLDFQAQVGITKHNGGPEATDVLFSRCHIEQAQEVLYVGSGIGVGPARIAKRYGKRVVGVDISPKMIEWSWMRAREEGVLSKVDFKVADILELPFDDDRFDTVLCESVVAFVEDKQRAIRECIRVTKPGGWVGLNETVWLDKPPPKELVEKANALGTKILTAGEWKGLWDQSGLRERSIDIRSIDSRKEIQSRLQWVGARWALRAFGRLFLLYLTKPAIRKSIKDSFDAPLEVLKLMGYALFIGKK